MFIGHATGWNLFYNFLAHFFLYLWIPTKVVSISEIASIFDAKLTSSSDETEWNEINEIGISFSSHISKVLINSRVLKLRPWNKSQNNFNYFAADALCK
jgi:hypothetical protein